MLWECIMVPRMNEYLAMEYEKAKQERQRLLNR